VTLDIPSIRGTLVKFGKISKNINTTNPVLKICIRKHKYLITGQRGKEVARGLEDCPKLIKELRYTSK